MSFIQFNGPAIYQITVQGIVRQDEMPMLDMLSSKLLAEDQQVICIIQVKVKDQAHLLSVLNQLNANHCIILKVKYM